MRLWSIHPRFLDTQGLLALWREGLLAKKVLEGKTKGYTAHPQLRRFRNYHEPLAAINSFLYYVLTEALARGFQFDKNKIDAPSPLFQVIPVTDGQIAFEINHLAAKLSKRDVERHRILRDSAHNDELLCNPVFYVVSGGIEEWEKTAEPRRFPLCRLRRTYL